MSRCAFFFTCPGWYSLSFFSVRVGVCVCVCVCVHVHALMCTQLCLTLCVPMDWSSLGSYVHGILQARILEWVAIPFPREFSQPRDQTPVYHNAGKFLMTWATREAEYRHTKTKHSNMMLLIFIIFKLFLSNLECRFQLPFKTLQALLSHLVWSSWACADKDCCIQQSLTTLYVIL